MYPYCYVCYVLYIPFSSCQMALFGYPDRFIRAFSPVVRQMPGFYNVLQPPNQKIQGYSTRVPFFRQVALWLQMFSLLCPSEIPHRRCDTGASAVFMMAPALPTASCWQAWPQVTPQKTSPRPPPPPRPGQATNPLKGTINTISHTVKKKRKSSLLTPKRYM